MENAFNKVLEMNNRHISVRVTSGVNLLSNIFSKPVEKAFSDLYFSNPQAEISGIRSPTPKFSHTGILHMEDYSSSLHDSTIFLSNMSHKSKIARSKRRVNKSADRIMF